MGDDLDTILYNKLNQGKQLPENISNELKEIIYKSIYNEKTIKQAKYNSLSKMAAIACAIIISTTGIVYAGKVIYDKIWKNPEKTVGFYATEQNIKEENSMSEEEAKKIANKILQKFGNNIEKIQTIGLENSPNDYQLDWCVTTDNNTKIRFDAKNAEKFKVFFNSVLDEEIKKYRTTKVNAEKIARDLCKEYGYNLNEYNNVEVHGNLATEEESYIWYVDFYKEYDGIINPYENISIGFIPEINQIYYFTIQNLTYENNSIEVTDEQAKQVVLEAEEKIEAEYKIKDINVKIGIACMNGNAYLRLTDYKQYREQLYQDYPSKDIVEYRTDKRVRKVWKVSLDYTIPEDINEPDVNYKPLSKQYIYYVDATTGEIIGGSIIDI